jgi:hypothetical protein
MVSNSKAPRVDVDQTRSMRRQVGDLLQRLLADREVLEQKIAETGRRDPMKSITGRTALDTAIQATREMLNRMDALLEEMDQHIELLEPGHVPNIRRPVRSGRVAKAELAVAGPAIHP